jgi:hypothetical protein
MPLAEVLHFRKNTGLAVVPFLFIYLAVECKDPQRRRKGRRSAFGVDASSKTEETKIAADILYRR